MYAHKFQYVVRHIERLVACEGRALQYVVVHIERLVVNVNAFDVIVMDIRH